MVEVKIQMRLESCSNILWPKDLAHQNRSYFCDLRLRCPSQTPEITAISVTRKMVGEDGSDHLHVVPPGQRSRAIQLTLQVFVCLCRVLGGVVFLLFALSYASSVMELCLCIKTGSSVGPLTLRV